MLMRIFRLFKTLLCPPDFMLQDAGYRILLNPMALSSLLNRLAFCDGEGACHRDCVRIGSTVVLRNMLNNEPLTVRIVLAERPQPAQGVVSVTSMIGASLLGLRCGDMVTLKRPCGELKWELMVVNQSATEIENSLLLRHANVEGSPLE
ncbi:hypothetical protein GMES_0743 [Paraglaciecola mesophila KMM 241]|uniref:Transcription elongation factor GreA/GreB C-terminal domain-containing protein n=2 Tax=Paraglaciecola mesophila TaxID=197222 RepID=K6Z232_9ALTE|nr:hypothetical protein GMES_0743 [Paraglaciecola mesophila KMM 241]